MNTAEEEFLRLVASDTILAVGAEFPDSYEDTYARGVRDGKTRLAQRLLKRVELAQGSSTQERIAIALERIAEHLCVPKSDG
jgi:hypothetical protein